MSGRNLKILLAVSVALNLFAIAGGVAYAVTRAKVEERVAEQHKPGREGGFRQLVGQLKPEDRQAVKTAMRAAALSARPDFEAARDTRRAAVEAAGQDSFDAIRVQALLDQSRASEMRGRATLERGTIEMLQARSPEDRRILAALLSRKGPGGSNKPDHDARPPAPADAPPP